MVEGNNMKIIDCKRIRDKILNEETTEKLKGKEFVVLLKDDSPENLSYLKSIQRNAEKYGVTVVAITLPQNAATWDIDHVIKEEALRNREGRLPKAVLMVGFGPAEMRHSSANSSVLRYVTLLDSPIAPDVVRAVETILHSVMADKFDKPTRTVVIGRSELAVKAGFRLLKHNHTVVFCHTQTENLDEYCKSADVIVSFAGCPNLITGNMVKDGAVIVSVGCGFQDGKLCGDIDMESMKDRDVLVTGTPGGVGIVTTALLFESLTR